MLSPPVVKDLVLVGGGHAHVDVLKRFGMRPIPGLRLTLIARDVETPYSGMLPGLVAGHYTHDDCHIDLRPLARFAGARLYASEAIGIDREQRRVICHGRPPVPYDVLSLDIGSAPSLSRVPGAQTHATPVKPIAQFAARWTAIVERASGRREPMRFVTIGGGAAGVELTLAMEHRLRSSAAHGGPVRPSLSFAIATGGEVLEGHPQRVRARLRTTLAARGVTLLERADAARVDQRAVHLRDGRTLPFDELLWVTEAAAQSWLASTGLALDPAGFILVDEMLRSVSDPLVFAAGDIATSPTDPRPKAGVFAVRQGPPLADNLRRAIVGAPPRPFRPQRRFLSLISTGDKSAVASRGKLSASGPRLWLLKDWIDRRWMRQYRELPEMAAGRPARAGGGDPLGVHGIDPMRCGGCGAKVSAASLRSVLARLAPRTAQHVAVGLDAADDAAVVRPPDGKLLVQTVDFFRAFIDDPYILGRIAANHALGDIYAMGAEPLTALATATLPHAAPAKVEDDLYQLLRGALDVLDEAGAVLVGGHSAEGAELAIGLTVNGAVDEASILRKGGARAGDALILTKPIGTGVLLAAEMRGRAPARSIDGALAEMQRSSRTAMAALKQAGATACTDVTGFGLAGHLLEMLRASRLDAELRLAAVPLLDGAREAIAAGHASTLAAENRAARTSIRAADGISGPALELFFDPQTAGGLLAAVPSGHADGCLRALRAAGQANAAIIGRLNDRAETASAITIL